MSTESDLYEQTVRAILDALCPHLGYERVEGSTTPLGKDGNKDQVDVTIHCADGRTLLVECRRCNRPATKDHVRAFAMKVDNLGADGGLLVNCKGFQAGATKAAAHLGIEMATLQPDATDREYAFHLGRIVHLAVVGRGGARGTATPVVVAAAVGRGGLRASASPQLVEAPRDQCDDRDAGS